jgi:hypothetical protein
MCHINDTSYTTIELYGIYDVNIGLPYCVFCSVVEKGPFSN